MFRGYDGLRIPDFVKSGNFTVNRESPQARGLVFWAPFSYSPLPSNMVQPVPSLSLYGSAVGNTILQNGKIAKTGDGTVNSVIRFPGVVTDWGFTLSCWFLTSSLASVQSQLWVGNGASNVEYAHLQMSATSGDFRVIKRTTAEGEIATTAAGSIAVNTLNHTAGTFSAAASIAYLNGVASTPETTAMSAPSGWNRASAMGEDRGASRNFISGALTDWRIYDRVLTPTEIREIYDPSTRWDLYYEPGRRTYAFVLPGDPCDFTINGALVDAADFGSFGSQV